MNTTVTPALTVTLESFATDVLAVSQHRPVIVDFWAAWCGPCKAIAPLLEAIALERAGQAVIAKVDVDTQAELTARYGIRTIPTLLIFRDGQVVATLVGLHSKQDILSHLDAVIQPAAIA